jgi:hypothetical protein
VPEGAKNSRLKSYKELDENSSFLSLPNLDGADYLVTLLFEAGLVQSTGMGAVSLSWTEIESWLRVTQLNLSVWEKLTIKSMSEIYAGELGVATKRDAQAPYTHVDEALIADRTAIANKLKGAFAAFKKNRAENE